jgi:hypothetical protein
LYKSRLNFYNSNRQGSKTPSGTTLALHQLILSSPENQMVQSFGQVVPEGVLLPCHSLFARSNEIYSLLNTVVLMMRRKKLEGNKQGWYEDREVFIGLFLSLV